MKRVVSLEQYYTKPEVAAWCMSFIENRLEGFNTAFLVSFQKRKMTMKRGA